VRCRLVILEDLHWADDLSLEVLGHLSARLAERALLVAGTYRSDELYPQLPMRELRTRLVGQRLAEEIRLPRLTLDQTASMTSATLGRPAPAQVVAAIQERSDGIPLHVEELLAAIDQGAWTAGTCPGLAGVRLPRRGSVSCPVVTGLQGCRSPVAVRSPVACPSAGCSGRTSAAGGLRPGDGLWPLR
jgi:hypothetical protein